LKNRIEKYKNKLSEIEDYIQKDLIEYFSKIDYSQLSKEIQIVRINNEEDLNKIYTGIGFYIILTDYEFEDNNCVFEYDKHKAIYRGHSHFTKKRLLSHLANERYNKERKSNEPHYKVCLKIDNNVNGININKEPYKSWNWIVIIHKMKDSSKIIREQAELAFDKLYNKPSKSREI